MLTWTNEVMPVKQSAAVMVTMFVGFIYTVLLFLGYMMFYGWKLGYMAYMSIFIVVNVAISAILYTWLKTKGSGRFAAL